MQRPWKSHDQWTHTRSPNTRSGYERCDEPKGDCRCHRFTIPGLTARQGTALAKLLQEQLSTYNDLHLTLKHVHWNVVGPSFIGVHEMIDPQVVAVRRYADEVAERIAALGVSPQGTPGAIVRDRSWDDYALGRDTVEAHLAAVDLVYSGVIEDIRHRIAPHRKARSGNPRHADRPRRWT